MMLPISALLTILIQSSYKYRRVMMKEAIIQVYGKSLHYNNYSKRVILDVIMFIYALVV